jgi:DNA-directed RNA polymerase specialized sigma24 family protein
MSDTDEAILKTLRLLSLTALEGMKQRQQVDLLDRAGYGQSEIANLVGSTSKAISVRLAEVRKARKRSRPEKNTKAKQR